MLEKMELILSNCNIKPMETFENKIESKEKSSVDLSLVKFEVISEDDLHAWIKTERGKIENKEQWIADNQKDFDNNQEKIEALVKSGILKEGTIEAVREYRLGMLRELEGNSLRIREHVQQNLKRILQVVSERLGEYVREWKPENITIHLGVYEHANFCIDGNEIYADLVRLCYKQNPEKELQQGIAHELFHHWMEEARFEEHDEKDTIYERIANEGLAVYVSGQSIQQHHERQGRIYADYAKESLKMFEEFEDASENFEAFKQEFEDMGKMYVAGYEIVKTVADAMGKEKFAALLPKIKENPKLLFEMYKEHE